MTEELFKFSHRGDSTVSREKPPVCQDTFAQEEGGGGYSLRFAYLSPTFKFVFEIIGRILNSKFVHLEHEHGGVTFAHTFATKQFSIYLSHL